MGVGGEYPVGVKVCEFDGCTDYFPNHRHGAFRAQKAGWFTQRGGIVWCPKHVPDWVEGWRKQRNEKKRGDQEAEA